MPPSTWICLVFMTSHILVASAFTLSVTEIKDTGKVLFRELRDSECKVKCKSRKPRIMCGSDNVSYLSKCELKRARRCEGKKVTIKRRGKCSEEDVPMTKCFQERVEALSAVSEAGATDVFIPECTTDGLFAQVQCHQASGYCWCVSTDGKPIPKTSTKSDTPNCEPSARKRAKRPDKEKKPKRRNKRKGKPGCTQEERTRFNTNLVRVFTEEYNRALAAGSPDKPYDLDVRKETLDKEVVNWKFTYYDKNKDDLLQKKEVNELRRLVKKFIKPRSCAKRFLKYCDKDRDKVIQLQEWTYCLGVGKDYDKKLVTSPEPEVERAKGEHITNVLTKKRYPTQSSSGRSEGDEDDHPLLPPTHTLGADLSTDFGRPRPNPSKLDKQDKDCLTDRNNALEQHADNPDGGFFIPNCTADGKFERAQCHKSAGYCWCVDEETGRPISNTATVGVMPDCAAQEDDRKIKGCSFVDKQKFISDLLNQMKKEMAEYALDNSTDHSILVSDPEESLQERVARWMFGLLDTNKNEKLQANELEQFQKTMNEAKVKSTRKCARKFLSYCDEDGDHAVELSEWQECLGISRQTNLPLNPKRTGKNPFDRYLRDN